MRAGALAPYEHALRTQSPLAMRTDDGRVVTLDIERWLAAPDAADESVLDRCDGPVLDVGCGPGRFVRALHHRGIGALGVDIAEAAVALTRSEGLPVLCRSVFATLPGEGCWPTVLLIDGNIGIGGSPLVLLHRVRTLLAPGGRVVIETHDDDAAHELLEVRFSSQGEPVGPLFDWAVVGLTALRAYAAAADYDEQERWSESGRSFVVLAPRERTSETA